MSAVLKLKTEAILAVNNIEVIYDHVILVLRGCRSRCRKARS